MKKVVAIGGGKNGRIKDGIKDPYETYEIDKEIVELSGKENPNFLFVSHAQTTPELEKGYFETMCRIYEEKFGCNCFWFSREDLKQKNFDKAYNADIIYVGGGDTQTMMKLWKEYGFDKILLELYEKGTVLSGLSAGANCWFKNCSSDSLRIQNNDPLAPMIDVECLGFFDYFFTPHLDEPGRSENMKELLKKDAIGLGASNGAAFKFIDGNFSIIKSLPNAYAEKCYYVGDKYIIERL